MEAVEISTPGLYALAGLAGLGGAWAGGRGIRLLVRGLRGADDPSAPLWVIRGIRGIVVAVAAAALTGGMLFGQTWLLVFGAVFLAEELYETGVIALVLRAGQRQGAGGGGQRVASARYTSVSNRARRSIAVRS
jgi:hypothetical protein